MDKYDELLEYSDPVKVRRNLRKYLGKNVKLYISTRKNKKYMVMRPEGTDGSPVLASRRRRTWSHFGQLPYEDYTKHRNELRRIRYLQRATNIRGNWAEDPYSSNMLSINLLWQ
jgi:hypothetical protein